MIGAKGNDLKYQKVSDSTMLAAFIKLRGRDVFNSNIYDSWLLAFYFERVNVNY